MSRWAELFAALSQPHANSAKRSEDERAGPIGTNWQSVHANRSVIPSTPQSAEILGFGIRNRAIGTIGTSGAGSEREGETPPRAADLLAMTVLPKGANSSADPKEGACVLRTWAEGYAVLCAMPPPARFWPERWRRILDPAGIFIDRWGIEAIRLGWTDLDVFGVDPGAPAARFDAMGLAMLLGGVEVVAIDAGGADLVTVTGARQRFRRRPLPPGTITLWELTR